MALTVFSTLSPPMPRLITTTPCPGYVWSNDACNCVGYALGVSMNRWTMFGRPTSPSVRLSPNASYFVAAMVKPDRVTLNEQDAWRDCASLAAQVTDVVPSGKDEPDARVQLVVTGGAPPVTVGGG